MPSRLLQCLNAVVSLAHIHSVLALILVSGKIVALSSLTTSLGVMYTLDNDCDILTLISDYGNFQSFFSLSPLYYCNPRGQSACALIVTGELQVSQLSVSRSPPPHPAPPDFSLP